MIQAQNSKTDLNVSIIVSSLSAMSEEERYAGKDRAGDAIHAQIGKMKAVLDERKMVS